MNFIDICSGIGGFRSALEMNGHNCLAFAEIDKYAKQSYRAIYDTDGEEELNDITTITDEHFRLYRRQCDIITGGFPCQSFSIAGNRAGFDDTRGTIFFHIARAIKEIQPSYVLLENVKGLFSHDKGRTFGTIIQALDELGYVTEWGLFNSKYWGVPQNRERVYILVTRKDKFKGPVLFDLLKQQTEVTTRLIDVLEDEVDEKYYLSEEKTKKLTLDTDLGGKLNMYDYNERDKVHSVEKVNPTLNTMQGGDRQPKIAVKGFKEMVSVRKFDVDIEKLKVILKSHKSLSNKQIANKLNVPVTKVEHWFRNDKSFAIPDKDVWYQLKELLNIETDEFDLTITTFIDKESEFETTNRVYDSNHLSPTLNTTNEPKIAIQQIGNIVDNKETFGGNPQRGRIYNARGLSPALNCMRGGGLEPKVAVLGNTSATGHRSQDIHDTNGISPTIAARDYKGAKQIAEVQQTGNTTDAVIPVLTPDRVNKRQNGRRFKEDGEPMFTLTSQDRHGIAVREATKQGYAVAEQGDSVNVSYPTSKTRRGRVGKQVAQTLQAGEVNQGVVMNDVRIRKLTPLECWRLQGFTDEQFYKAKDSGVSNSQLYKQAGNSVSVPVVDAIVKCL